MNQLVKGMPAIGTWLTPVNGTGLIGNHPLAQGNTLTVTLHSQLLQTGWELFRIPVVRQGGKSLRFEEIRIPYCKGSLGSGILYPNGVLRKCPSMVRNPAGISRKCSGPIVIINERSL